MNGTRKSGAFYGHRWHLLHPFHAGAGEESNRLGTDSFRLQRDGRSFLSHEFAGNTKLPTVICLLGDSYPLGYTWVYRGDVHPIRALVKAGYAVLAFDQGGFGSRMNDISVETKPQITLQPCRGDIFGGTANG